MHAMQAEVYCCSSQPPPAHKTVAVDKSSTHISVSALPHRLTLSATAHLTHVAVPWHVPAQTSPTNTSQAANHCGKGSKHIDLIADSKSWQSPCCCTAHNTPIPFLPYRRQCKASTDFSPSPIAPSYGWHPRLTASETCAHTADLHQDCCQEYATPTTQPPTSAMLVGQARQTRAALFPKGWLQYGAAANTAATLQESTKRTAAAPSLRLTSKAAPSFCCRCSLC